MTDHATRESTQGLDRDDEAQLTLAASPGDVFDALTTLAGLAAWWAPVSGDGRAGGELTFSFTVGAAAVMRVDEAEADAAAAARVRWTVLACHLEDWVGTTVHFDLDGLPTGGTELRFRHAGLTPRLECFSDCKNGWDHFIPSLRAYVELGTGEPFMSDADVARREARAHRGQPVEVG
jgi:uncharacterized protein YndB with AHSA1/START domain